MEDTYYASVKTPYFDLVSIISTRISSYECHFKVILHNNLTIYLPNLEITSCFLLGCSGYNKKIEEEAKAEEIWKSKEIIIRTRTCLKKPSVCSAYAPD